LVSSATAREAGSSSKLPARQERFSARQPLVAKGATPEEVDVWLERFDEVVELMRTGATLTDVPGWEEGVGIRAPIDLEIPIFPDDAELWAFAALIFDYDPRAALERIRVRVLALFGKADAIVPVEESVAVYREAVPPELLSVAVFPGASHRVLLGDPPRLADGYLETLSAFVAGAVAA
jgi:uncharacterized protein